MERLTAKDFVNPIHAEKFDNDLIAKFLIQLKRFNKINKIYSQNLDKDGIEFIDSVLETLGIKFEVAEEDLSRIPADGAFITVSNHPFGGLDGLILLKIISEKRPDYKLMANYLLHKIDSLKDFSIPVNQVENTNTRNFSFTEVKRALKHLEGNSALGIFPAGLISKAQGFSRPTDRKWDNGFLSFIKKAEVPVVPVYFQGNNSWVFHLLGGIHPLLQSVRMPKEYFNKTKKVIHVRIGRPISIEEQQEFKDLELYGRFLRAKTYALGTTFEVKKFFRPQFIPRVKKVEPIIPAVPLEKLLPEIELMREKYHLFDSSEFSCMCAPSVEIPNVLNEIGRLREITFREVGEGTNRSLDLDEFDLYFNQLIVWDNTNKRISGAYRLGRGDEIMRQYGVKGFYIQSLFKIAPGFYPTLEQSLEMGRSFILKEYQRRPLSLFMLWKGILYFLLKNTQYRYLIGPASISNDFSKFSQSLIIDFFKSNYYNHELAKHITPRMKFKIKHNPNFDNEVFIKNTSSDVAKLDKFIQDIEPNYRTPVLFKKYIGLNAKLLGFNVDPLFNYCVDGLMVLDIFDVPFQTLKSLSKELDDESILLRFQ